MPLENGAMLAKLLNDVRHVLEREVGGGESPQSSWKRTRKEEDGEMPKDVEGGADFPTRAALRNMGPLATLRTQDWDVVLHPIGELRPYLTATVTPTGRRGAAADRSDPLADYVKCRMAELPMRLQCEALQLRRHEQSLRHHMKELLQLSEFLAFVDRALPAEVEDGNMSAKGWAADALTAPVEAQRRERRALERAAELENFIRVRTRDKIRCAERMVLLSAMTALLLERVGTE